MAKKLYNATAKAEQELKPEIVHLGTSIQAVFGLKDASGNIVKEFPTKPVRLGSLSINNLMGVASQLMGAWENLKNQELPQPQISTPQALLEANGKAEVAETTEQK